MNPYLDEVYMALPSLYAQFDTDPFSPTRGIGDRLYWAWKVIDFPNATMQGTAHGLSRLYQAALLPDEFRSSFWNRLDDIFCGTSSMRRSNGSVEEAFPYESSFCVTALVAFDLLSALELISGEISEIKKARYFKVLEPMIRFLECTDESHGFISNHLATAAAALFKWATLTGDQGEDRGRVFLKLLLTRQSSEGWYLEYEGADPGYQTLCMHYLADLDRLRPDLSLENSLRASARFLWNFAHPDGSFGGYYGSRNTRFYYPSGIRYLAPRCGEAAALDVFMSRAVCRKSVVTLAAQDPPNFAPMFNSYVWAAVTPSPHAEFAVPVPCARSDAQEIDFPAAGLHIRSSSSFYTIVSSKKGGVVAHFDRTSAKMSWNCGAVVEDRDGKRYSTQWYRPSPNVVLGKNEFTITSGLVKINHRLPTPFDFLVLRTLNLTVMRLAVVSNLVKRLLVWMLITRKPSLPAAVKRKIVLGSDGKLAITDTWDGPAPRGFRLIAGGVFRSIHMASSGYWQRGDT